MQDFKSKYDRSEEEIFDLKHSTSMDNIISISISKVDWINLWTISKPNHQSSPTSANTSDSAQTSKAYLTKKWSSPPCRYNPSSKPVKRTSHFSWAQDPYLRWDALHPNWRSQLQGLQRQCTVLQVGQLNATTRTPSPTRSETSFRVLSIWVSTAMQLSG